MADDNSIMKYAKFFNEMGYSIAFGKIFGYLVARDSGTFDEIRNDLHLSKGSVSMTLKAMQQNGYVDYTLKPGDRKKHFRISFTNWEAGLSKRINNSRIFVNMLQITLDESQISPEQGKTITKLVDFEELFQEKIQEIIAEFKPD